MIEMFTKCDPDYGQRVADGIRKAQEAMKQNSNGSTGHAARNEEGVEKAEQTSTEARPY